MKLLIRYQNFHSSFLNQETLILLKQTNVKENGLPMFSFEISGTFRDLVPNVYKQCSNG